MEQPSEEELKSMECVQGFRQNAEDPNCVGSAFDILSKLHGCELSRILKSLGLPGYAGKSKKKKIDTLIKCNEDGKAWIVTFPEQVIDCAR